MRKIIYITVDKNGDDSDSLLAWPTLDAADDGIVGVYELVEEISLRSVKEIKNKGTKKWYKP